MIVLAFDPSTSSTGWAVLDDARVLDSGQGEPEIAALAAFHALPRAPDRCAIEKAFIGGGPSALPGRAASTLRLAETAGFLRGLVRATHYDATFWLPLASEVRAILGIKGASRKRDDINAAVVEWARARTGLRLTLGEADRANAIALGLAAYGVVGYRSAKRRDKK